MEFTFNATLPPPTAVEIPKEPPDRGKTITEPPISFRDKVLGKQAMERKERVDLLATKMVRIEHVQGNRLLPMLHVEEKMIQELSQPWQDTLVVKLLGKTLGFNIMKAKLTSTWKLEGAIDLMDVGNGFFMIKFDRENDRLKVINGGPWMVFDHYLAVRQWDPLFNAARASIDKTMVWVRIPSLNLAYYDENLSWALASAIGNPIKVGTHTLKMERGRFARLCVEIDLNKPVIGKVGINGEWYQVQYEGLHIICTQCGCYGHYQKDCTVSVMKSTNAGATNGNESNAGGTTNFGTEEPQNASENHTNKTANSASTVATTQEFTAPGDLHGDWITIARKKWTPKNSQENNKKKKNGDPPKTHNSTRYAALRKETTPNINQPTHEASQMHSGEEYATPKVWLKKKRQRHETPTLNIGLNNVTSTDTVVDPTGVYAGGYTVTRRNNFTGITSGSNPRTVPATKDNVSVNPKEQGRPQRQNQDQIQHKHTPKAPDPTRVVIVERDKEENKESHHQNDKVVDDLEMSNELGESAQDLQMHDT